jgi:hypothetical protein
VPADRAPTSSPGRDEGHNTIISATAETQTPATTAADVVETVGRAKCQVPFARAGFFERVGVFIRIALTIDDVASRFDFDGFGLFIRTAALLIRREHATA